LRWNRFAVLAVKTKTTSLAVEFALVPDLDRLTTAELMSLFATLEAPSLDELVGEFDGRMLAQPKFYLSLWWTGCLRNPIWPGWWLGKAFRPVNEQEGRGYNRFRHLGRLVERFPFRTLIAPSRFDGRPALQLVYRAYYSACGGVHMVDEVRRVEPGRYLLIGTFGFDRYEPNPFVLTGPVAPYRNDIGVERPDFSLVEELPQLAGSDPQR
jgi:hypothetical protein